MPRDHYEDNCEGCKPVILDAKTMQPVAPDDPANATMDRVWAKLTLEERKKFHRLTCLNSRDPDDLTIAKTMHDLFEQETKQS